MKTDFSINISPDIITDLKSRLAATRWPDEIENAKWNYGTNKDYLKELCTYWQNDFDWKKQEDFLNTFAHFETEIDDHRIHFIHEKGKSGKRVPLLLSHGWPDSFYRFYKLIPLLTATGEDGLSFDVIVPSIPGFGFSSASTKKGMDSRHVASLFNHLMTDVLGYEKYVAHGGDWGGSITENLALYHSDNILGIHLTDLPFAHTLEEPDDMSAAEKKFYKKGKQWGQTEGGYSIVQSTKPESLGYGLNDSPTGLAGWIIEKFFAWSDNHGNLENSFSRDELLTNITIYWVTQTINSSMRIYYEEMQTLMSAKYNPLMKLNPFDKTGKKTKVPAGFALFPKDIIFPPKELVERFFNIQQWTEMTEGGHFAALEEPELLANDIRKFVTAIM